MLTLGVETSCDDTGVALMRDGKVLGTLLSSQVEVHSLFGGVVPEIASREHYRMLAALYDKLLDDCAVSPQDIDTVAVARGPGLLGCLLVGMGFAKGVAYASGARLTGVNHLHAHLLAAGIEQEFVFPALGLLVSGGHTHLYHIESEVEFTLLGKTLDDAAGEAFDKVAKMLNLPYPGGRYLDVLSQGAQLDKKMFTRPYLRNQNLDFSFSGLKTAMANHVAAHPHLRSTSVDLAEEVVQNTSPDSDLARFCAAFNFTVADTLRAKTERAFDQMKEQGRGVRSLMVAGGVAANSWIRSSMAGLAEKNKIPLLLPSLDMCTDNGVMIAFAGELQARRNLFHDQSLEAIPRGMKIPDDFMAMD